MDDPTKSLRFVSGADPALDWGAMNVYDYVATRDASLIRTIPGQAPIWWSVRPLDVDQWASIEETSSPQRRLIQCVMHALESVEAPDAPAWRPTRQVQGGDGKQITICSHDEMRHLFESWGGTRLYEVGSVIYERAAVGKAQSGAARFTPLPVLLDELAAIARRHVERTQATSTTGTSPSS